MCPVTIIWGSASFDFDFYLFADPISYSRKVDGWWYSPNKSGDWNMISEICECFLHFVFIVSVKLGQDIDNIMIGVGL